MRKIAIPASGNMLSLHFGRCNYFKIYYVENQMILKEELIKAPVHKPGLLPKWLANMNVTDVVTGGIGHKAIEIFNQNKINVFVGVEVKQLKDLLNDFMNGTLETDGNLCDH